MFKRNYLNSETNYVLCVRAAGNVAYVKHGLVPVLGFGRWERGYINAATFSRSEMLSS